MVEPLLVGDTVNKTLICATWYSRASKPRILVLGPSPVDNENTGDVSVPTLSWTFCYSIISILIMAVDQMISIGK